MDIENTIGKFLNPVEKNAALIGAGVSMLTPGVMDAMKDSVMNLIGGRIHAPEFNNIASHLRTYPENWMPAVGAAIVGYLLKDSVDNRMIKRIAGITQNAGLGYLAGYAAFELLYFSTHSPSPALRPVTIGNNATGAYQGDSNNPLTGIYGAM
jgi:hypothetical protein